MHKYDLGMNLKAFVRGIVVLAVSLLSIGGWSQTSRLPNSATFTNEEELYYSINFQWGLVRGKLAEASITNKKTRDGQYFSQLLMRTTSLADTFYPMRDTLETLYSAQELPLRFEKRVNDNGYIANDVSTYNYSLTTISVKNTQNVNGTIEVDTTMFFKRTDVEVLDLLSTLTLLRTIDYVNPTKVAPIKAVVSLGNENVGIEYQILGTETVSMPDGTKRQAIKVGIRVDNSTFRKGRNAILVWLTRDQNLVPVRIKAELKIGAAYLQLTSYKKVRIH